MSKRDEKYVLFAFDSPHGAIKSEKLFVNLEVKMIPTLREISASCGMSIRLKEEYADKALKILEASDVDKWGFYKVKREAGVITANLIKKVD